MSSLTCGGGAKAKSTSLADLEFLRALADPHAYEVAELCPCCYEDESAFAVAGCGAEPASLRAAESCSTDAFYTQCYETYVADVGHADSCSLCVEFGHPTTGAPYSTAA